MNRKPTIIFLFLITFSLLLVAFDLTEKVAIFKNFIAYVFLPLPNLSMKLIATGKQIQTNIVSIVKTHQENIELKSQLNKLSFIKTQYEVIKEENKNLRAVLKLSERIEYEFITSRIISHDPVNWFKCLIIDKGKLSKLTENLPVATLHNNELCLVGRTVELHNKIAKILLLTDPLSYVPAKIARTQETGVIVGKNKNLLLLDYLLPESNIKIGDKIITSEISEIFPEGISIGTVERILTSDGYYKQALVKPSISCNQIKTVFVLLPFHEKKKDKQKKRY
ncbi:MAG: rod shape-determining protein MreC [Elusimicrobiota bacterium]|nr:rod shape-determining protein MreC [Elusimicrobiota bacterium]